MFVQGDQRIAVLWPDMLAPLVGIVVAHLAQVFLDVRRTPRVIAVW
mgnify:CR=1 FL=1